MENFEKIKEEYMDDVVLLFDNCYADWIKEHGNKKFDKTLFGWYMFASAYFIGLEIGLDAQDDEESSL